MAKKETAPKTNVPNEAAKDRPVHSKADNKTGDIVTDGAKRAKAQWDKEYRGTKATVPVPGTSDMVTISKLEYTGNAVSVWVGTDTSLPPDFVIVNPPTQVYIDKDNIVENPIGVIAHAINGATK